MRVNSSPLYQLSYQGISSLEATRPFNNAKPNALGQGQLAAGVFLLKKTP
jgi:hypothetical protein